LQEGIDLIRKGPRSCGTSMLVACGKPPDAAVVEFDHEQMVVRRPERGFVGAANSFFTLYQEPSDYDPHWGRIGTARDLALKGNHSFASNIAGAEGVPIASMNLHSAMVDATHLRIKVAMGRIPAFRRPYRAFRLSPDGLVADPEANQDPLVRDPPPSWNPPDSDR
jgi:hypothetical protein